MLDARTATCYHRVNWHTVARCRYEPRAVVSWAEIMHQQSRPQRILVVEDDGEVAALLQGVLSSYGYDVEMADELSAVQASREHLPDLILLDLLMPGVSGMEAARHLHELPETSDIPIVLMSGAPDVAQCAVQLGAAGYLKKPFELDDLLAVVTRVLGSTT
jgi:CheY-like chemotaxis protein